MSRGARRWSLHHAAAWVATAVLIALCAYVLWNQRQESLRLSELTLRNTAVLLAEQVESEFDQVDALLQSVGYRYAHAARPGAQELARLTDEVRHDAAANPLIKRVGVVDRDGINTFNTGAGADAARPNVSEREYFRRAKAGERGLIFDGPLVPKLTPDWSIILARRIDDSDGEFLGVVFASIPVKTIGEFLSNVELGPSGVVNLRTADLAQVARVPAVDTPAGEVGNRNVSQAVRKLLSDQPGLDRYVFRTVAPLDGVERLNVTQKFQHSPFWLTVGRATDESAGILLRAAVSLALVVVPVTVLFFWSARRIGREQQQLKLGIAERTRDLDRSERFFRGLTGTLPALIGYWDEGLHNRFANLALGAWFGKTPDEISGRHLGELLGPELLGLDESFYRAALAGKAQTFERQWTRPDGRTGDLLVTLTPDRVDGRVQGVFSQAVEITELKRAEAAILRQSQELDDLYNHAPCGYHSLDSEGTVLRVNDTELQWLGYTRDEMVGRRISSFLTPGSVNTFRQNFPLLLSTGLRNELEMEFVRRDGRIVPILLWASVQRDEQGRFVSTRAALIDYSRTYQERATLRRVLTASPMAVRVAGLKDNRILFLNQAFCTLVQRPEDEARGMDISTTYVDPAVFDDIRKRLRQGEMVLNRLVELQLPDRPEVPPTWALASYMTIEYDGQAAALAWLFDVTELQQARATAEAASRAKSTFLANMSHEIRTPLNAIMGLNHLLQRDEADDLQRGRLAKVQTASRHLLQVINDILDFSKIESGRMTLELREFVLDEVVQRAVTVVRPKADEKQLDLSVDTGQLPERLLGDPTRLAQVLINLLGNALKFTTTGWVKLHGERMSEDDTSLILRFEVQDTGPGIPADQQAHLFDAFEQGDSSTTRLHGGTGLGLALTRHFAQLMGGSSGLRSVPGIGSTFWFTARLGKVARVPEPARPSSPGTATSSAEDRLRASHAGARILLAEDNPINQEVAVALLQGVGLVVDTVMDGRAAVELARSKPYALILMDMQMPGMDGLDATRHLRRAGLSDTPIIAMTANAFGDDRITCLDAGMNDHLAKPVEPEALYAVLLHWLSPVHGARTDAAARQKGSA
jgi:PAS domain S-box-containing protein